jgi:hypothetical protein
MEALLREEPGVALTVKQQVIAGAGAGLAVSFLACPTELIKCRSVEPVQFFVTPNCGASQFISHSHFHLMTCGV